MNSVSTCPNLMVLSREDAIYMVSRSLQKLGGDSNTFRCVHSRDNSSYPSLLHA